MNVSIPLYEVSSDEICLKERKKTARKYGML
jgi:hypothetical protein